MHRSVMVVTVAALLCAVAVAGCEQSAGVGVSGTPPTTTTSASTSPTTTATATAPTVAPAVAAANRALTASLFTLVERSRTLQSDKSLRPTRQAAADGLAAARASVKLERQAAYASVRSCSSVLSHAAAARAAAARSANARTASLTAATSLRTKVKSLDAAVAAVSGDLTALRSALASSAQQGGSVSVAEVQAALAAAASQRKATLADIATTVQQTAKAATSASASAATASSIAAKTC